jgi:adenosylhomocysteine nucleosidase
MPVILAAIKQELAPLRKTLKSSDVRLVRTGVGLVKAERATRRHCAGTDLIVSTGCCGGLVDQAPAGTLVIPQRVLYKEEEAPPPDITWQDRAHGIAEKQGLRLAIGPLITVDKALQSPHAKRDCHRRTGALAVDMETAAIARAAAEMDVPYVSIRVVLDGVEDILPEINPTNSKGQLRPSGLVQMARRPRNLLIFGSLILRLRSVSANLVRCIEGLLEAHHTG